MTPPASMRLNELPDAEARAALHLCCGSNRWVEAMLKGRPFASLAALQDFANRTWFGLARADWLEAFSHHPRIGERNLDRYGAGATQSGREQSGMNAASEPVHAEFARLNRDYEAKFGHVFLICASGKSAQFMLEQITSRIANTPEVELKNAAAEQSKIVRLRLERLVNT